MIVLSSNTVYGATGVVMSYFFFWRGGFREGFPSAEFVTEFTDTLARAYGPASADRFTMTTPVP